MHWCVQCNNKRKMHLSMYVGSTAPTIHMSIYFAEWQKSAFSLRQTINTRTNLFSYCMKPIYLCVFVWGYIALQSIDSISFRIANAFSRIKKIYLKFLEVGQQNWQKHYTIEQQLRISTMQCKPTQCIVCLCLFIAQNSTYWHWQR